MTIKSYLRNVLKDIRSDYNYSGIEIWNKIQTSTSNDAYGRAATISSGSGVFSGSLAWGRTIQRKNGAGGFYPTGDVQIVASLDAKTGAGGVALTSENVYLVAEGVALKVVKIIEASDTNEMVITCERISE